MIRRVLCAVAAFGITTALLFPLYLLWVGDSPFKSLFAASVSGFLSVVATLTVSRRDSSGDYPMPLWVKVFLATLGALVLVGMAVWDICENGVAEGVTRYVALGLTTLSGAVAYHFCAKE